MKRRHFIKAIPFSIAGAGLFLQSCSKKEAATPVKAEADKVVTKTAATGEVEYISESNILAKNLGYKEDANSIDPAIRIEKAGVKGVDQLCSNCEFYKPDGSVKGAGKCTLIPKGLAKENAWCKSWTPKQS